jgi:hypothetical protein
VKDLTARVEVLEREVTALELAMRELILGIERVALWGAVTTFTRDELNRAVATARHYLKKGVQDGGLLR